MASAAGWGWGWGRPERAERLCCSCVDQAGTGQETLGMRRLCRLAMCWPLQWTWLERPQWQQVRADPWKRSLGARGAPSLVSVAVWQQGSSVWPVPSVSASREGAPLSPQSASSLPPPLPTNHSAFSSSHLCPQWGRAGESCQRQREEHCCDSLGLSFCWCSEWGFQMLHSVS